MKIYLDSRTKETYDNTVTEFNVIYVNLESLGKEDFQDFQSGFQKNNKLS